MKRKGFTLIELLAVIIILAVVALITVPTILDVVDSAKEKSRISSVNSLLDATRLYMSEAMLDDSIDLSGNLLDVINNRVKGTKPDEGEIRIDGNDIGIAVKIDGYCYIKDYNEEEIRKTNDSECQIYKEVIAECYGEETEVIDTIEINYEGCVNYFSDAEDLTQDDIDKICKNEEKVDGIYLKEYIMILSTSAEYISDFVDNNVVEVTYKKVCQTCFEYQKNIDFDINYDNCMEEFEDDTFCKGQRIEIEDDLNVNIYELLDLYGVEGLAEFAAAGIIENLRYADNATITDYLCYEGNELDLPTITNLETPTSINGLKVNSIGVEAFAEKGLTNITISHGIKTIGFNAFENNPYKTVDIARTVETIGDYAFGKDEMIKDQTIINRTGKKFDWSGITESNYGNQTFIAGKVYHQNGNIKVISSKNSNEKNEYLTEATCYDGEIEVVDIVDNMFSINYDGCMANFNSVFDKEYTEEELDKICKNEEKINDNSKNYYLQDVLVYYYFIYGNDELIKLGIVNTKKECQTCFEYATYEVLNFDIDYDNCISYGWGSSINVEDLCSGRKVEIDGKLYTLNEEFINSDKLSLINFISSNLIENIKLNDNTSISDYLCYSGNSYNLPTITNLVIPDKINDHLVTSIGYEAFYNNQITSVKLPNSITSIATAAFKNNQISGELDLSNTSLVVIEGSDIPGGAFENNQITSVKLPNSITTIGRKTFSSNQISGELDLSNLTNLTTIGSSAFAYNSNLTLIEIDNTKDAISGSPWGAYNATVNWLRSSD